MDHMIETRESALATALRERGQRATPQRLAIARVLTDLDRHVTAEHVHAEVSARMPGVSLPTVYATLDLLEALGLARRVATEGGAVVYDPRTDEHHHLVCRGCGAIADVDAPVDTAGVLAAAARDRVPARRVPGRAARPVRRVRGEARQRGLTGSSTCRAAVQLAKRPSDVSSHAPRSRWKRLSVRARKPVVGKSASSATGMPQSVCSI